MRNQKIMYKQKWKVYDERGKYISTKTLSHYDGALYNKLVPFEKELNEKGLYAELHSEWSIFTGEWVKIS